MFDADPIDLIYEAAVVPDRWPAALDALAGMASGLGTILFVLDQNQIGRWVASEGLVATMTDWVAGRWYERTKRSRRMIALRHAGFVTELDIYSEAELAQEPDYTGFFYPRGMGWGAGTFVGMPSGDTAIFTLERRFADGPVTRAEIARLDHARPHLARAALLAARLEMERARTAAATLEALGLPAALLRSDGRVAAANARFDALTTTVVATAHGGIALKSQQAQTLLQIALSRLDRHDCVRSIAIPATEERDAAICHVLPMRGAAHDVFSGIAAIVVITPVARAPLPDADLLRGLYDLTPAEARLAASLMSGQTLQALSEASGQSRETLKTHLSAVFAKTGTCRQSELTSLLAISVTPFRS